MTTGADLGIGTKLAFETTVGASPIAFTEVPQVLDIPDVVESREFVETTNQDSENRRREYIGGLIDVEEITIPMNYLPLDANQNALSAMLNEVTPRWWRLRETTVSPEKVQYFQAFVSMHARSYPVADKKQRQITLRRTGPVYEDALP